MSGISVATGAEEDVPPGLIVTPTSTSSAAHPNANDGNKQITASSYFFASSPTSPTDGTATATTLVSPSSSSYSASPEEYVLPHHSGSGVAGSQSHYHPNQNGTVFRRIRTSLLRSPAFQSPLAKRVMNTNTSEEENILVQSYRNGGGRKRGRGGRNGGPFGSNQKTAVCLLGAAALTGGLWFLSGGRGNASMNTGNVGGSSLSSDAALAKASTPVFTFRPDPIEGTPSADAVDLYRQAYGIGITGDESEKDDEDEDGDAVLPYIDMDDPMNPGSIFVVLDLIEDMVDETTGLRDGANTLITSDGSLFGTMDAFDKGLRRHLVERFPLDEKNEKEKDGPAQMMDVTSYYSVLSDGLPHIARSQYATPDGYTALMEIKFAIPGQDSQSHETVDAYSRHVVRTIEAYVHENLPREVEAQFTGLPLFRMDLSASGAANANAANAGRPLSLADASLDDILPPSSPSLDAYHHLANRFGDGVVSPYKIVFDHSDDEKSIDTDAGFRLMHKVMAAFAQVDLENETREEEAEEEMETIAGLAAVNLDSIPQRIEDGHMAEHLSEVMDELYGRPSYSAEEERGGGGGGGRRPSKPIARTVYNGIAVLRNNQVPYPLYLGAKICREKQHHHCNLELLHYFTAMTDAMTSTDRMTTYVSATLGVDPFSKYGLAWLLAARMKTREMERNGDLDGYRVHIVGGAALEYDAWFHAGADEAQNDVDEGGGEEPPSTTIGDDSTIGGSSSSSSSKFVNYVLLPTFFVLVALGIRSALSAAGSKHRRGAYSHKKF